MKEQPGRKIRMGQRQGRRERERGVVCEAGEDRMGNKGVKDITQLHSQ